MDVLESRELEDEALTGCEAESREDRINSRHVTAA